MTVDGLAGPVRLWATLKTLTKSAFKPASAEQLVVIPVD
jgi:hypothetical protein